MAQKGKTFLKQNTREKPISHRTFTMNVKGSNAFGYQLGWEITTGVDYFGLPGAFPTDISNRLMCSNRTQMVEPRILQSPIL